MPLANDLARGIFIGRLYFLVRAQCHLLGDKAGK